MERINSFEYNVAPGEEVTIKVTPTSVGTETVALAFNGRRRQPQAATASTTPTWVLSVSENSGDVDVAKMEFSFPGAPQTAKYSVAISGSEGGSGSFTKKPSSPVKDPNITFFVQ